MSYTVAAHELNTPTPMPICPCTRTHAQHACTCTLCQANVATKLAKASRSGEIELFGDLVKTVEELVDNDMQLREQLRKLMDLRDRTRDDQRGSVKDELAQVHVGLPRLADQSDCESNESEHEPEESDDSTREGFQDADSH